MQQVIYGNSITKVHLPAWIRALYLRYFDVPPPWIGARRVQAEVQRGRISSVNVH